jgi:hypothetical protein
MAEPPRKIIEDEEEFMNDVAAFHEKRGYVETSEERGPVEQNADGRSCVPGQPSIATPKSVAGPSPCTSYTRWSWKEVVMMS